MPNYISLFSCAGVGCYGFLKAGYGCIATNELIASRLAVQRLNNKCKYDTGYIDGDITVQATKDAILTEINRWRNVEDIKTIDVVVATPPCQGISCMNLKKSDEQQRNSLVVEAIKMILIIQPRFFVIENVRAFMKTTCTDMDGKTKSIADALTDNLAKNYEIAYRVLNFKDYGVPSSRTRTLVIGVHKGIPIKPDVLFPQEQAEITLREAIGDLPSLSYGEISAADIYHYARVYPEYMRDWFTGLREGASMMENDVAHRPYKLVHGKREELKCATTVGDKFRRLCWNKPAPCIHTRSDCLGSQSTIHPRDDRVLSIRELMHVMTVPDDFKWVSGEDVVQDKVAFLKKHDLNIRRCLGEAVPTYIIEQIALNIKAAMPQGCTL